MLYYIVKFFTRVALKLFCRRVVFSNKAILQSNGPLLLACNHPNSFLDAIIIGSYFNKPVHFLARGDAFRKPFAKKLLTALRMIPIYRLSEGSEYLALNDVTFEKCGQILLDGGIVLIFSEGLCVNQWALRPLKKGTARIAFNAWQRPAIAGSFAVLPVSLNYNGFKGIGKRLIIHFGQPITKSTLKENANVGEAVLQFNNILSAQLQTGLLQSTGNNFIVQLLISNHPAIKVTPGAIIPVLKIKQQQAEEISWLKNGHSLRFNHLPPSGALPFLLNLLASVVLFVPAIAAWLAHWPLVYPVKRFVSKKTARTVFFDSVLFGLLLFTYPLYLLLLNIVALAVGIIILQLFLLCLPVFAWFYFIWKDCVQRVFNYWQLSAVQKKDVRKLLC